ncbi:hypothetical protein [Halostagnicola bangensis]
MISEQELIEKWHTHVFQSVEDDIRDLLVAFPDRRNLSISFEQCGTDYRFTAPLLSDPDRTLEAGRTALAAFVDQRFDELETNLRADERLYFRLQDVPDSVRYPLTSIRSSHLNRLITVAGTVRSLESPQPRVVTAVFECDRCGEETTVPQHDRRLRDTVRCQACQTGTSLRLVPDYCEYVDAQLVQLTDGDRTLPVSLEHDLTGSVEAGDRLELVTIPRARLDSETTRAEIELEAVSLDRRPLDEHPEGTESAAPVPETDNTV